MKTLDEVLAESSARHKHLCPRQVLGARMATYASELLDLDIPRSDKRLLVIAETDGCAVDGLIAATSCRVGSRTLRILDFGKVAATFTDTRNEASIRILPRRDVRSIASDYAPNAKNKWEAMLFGYQAMPLAELFAVEAVCLNDSVAKIVSKPGKKATCEVCGEEIINGREVTNDGQILCRPCAGEGYYQSFMVVQVRNASAITK